MAIVQNDSQTRFKKNEILKVRKLEYPIPGTNRFTVSVPTLSVNKGDFVLVIGENGAGKTTLVHLLAGYLPGRQGQIWINGKLQPKVEDLLLPGFRQTALVQQQPDLNPFLTVGDQLIKSSRGQVPGAWLAFHKQLVKWCKLKPLLNEKTGNLSGGERKRLALALSLSHPVDVLFLDEPFSDLDLDNQALFRSVLFQIRQSKSLAIVLVSHEPRSFLFLADVVYTISRGRIMEKTLRSPTGFFPKRERSARLLGFKNVWPGSQGSWHSIPPEAIRLSPYPNAHNLGCWQFCGFNYPSGRAVWQANDRFLESCVLPGEEIILRISEFYELFAELD